VTTRETIWIVDDQAEFCALMVDFLDALGYATRSFTCPLEILVALQATRNFPLLILSDIKMEDLSGLQLLVRVKQLHPQMPVVLMTAEHNPSDLQKPFSLSTLRDAIAVPAA
jgi:two-component system, NtrC family, nitrogen regulation response regulator GlnG